MSIYFLLSVFECGGVSLFLKKGRRKKKNLAKKSNVKSLDQTLTDLSDVDSLTDTKLIESSIDELKAYHRWCEDQQQFRAKDKLEKRKTVENFNS